MHEKEKVVDSLSQVDMSGLKFPQVAVYFHPDDFPEDCVARVFDNGQPTNVIMLRGSVWELEYDIRTNTNLAFFKRGAEDVPELVGVWM